MDQPENQPIFKQSDNTLEPRTAFAIEVFSMTREELIQALWDSRQEFKNLSESLSKVNDRLEQLTAFWEGNNEGA